MVNEKLISVKRKDFFKSWATIRFSAQFAHSWFCCYYYCAGLIQFIKNDMSHNLTVCQLTVPPCRGSFFPPIPPAAPSVEVSPGCKVDRILATSSSPDSAVSCTSDQITCKLLRKQLKRKLLEGSTVRTSAGVSYLFRKVRSGFQQRKCFWKSCNVAWTFRVNPSNDRTILTAAVCCGSEQVICSLL